MTEYSKDYYARRAEEERLAAEKASDQRAAESHRELAAHYARVARGEEQPASDEHGAAGSVSKDFRILP